MKTILIISICISMLVSCKFRPHSKEFWLEHNKVRDSLGVPLLCTCWTTQRGFEGREHYIHEQDLDDIPGPVHYSKDVYYDADTILQLEVDYYYGKQIKMKSGIEREKLQIIYLYESGSVQYLGADTGFHYIYLIPVPDRESSSDEVYRGTGIDKPRAILRRWGLDMNSCP